MILKNVLDIRLVRCISPPSNISIHDAMCDRYCLSSDLLRNSAMEASQCDCMELSTQNTSNSFTKAGDFCTTNSAFMLCNNNNHKIQMCNDAVKCDLSDFECPRLHYDMIQVETRGFGKECASTASALSSLSSLGYSYCAIILCYYFMRF